MADQVKVAVVRTAPHRVHEDYGRVLDLSGCGELLSGASDVIVYGGLTWSHFMPGSSSPPWQLDGLAAAIQPGNGWRWIAGTGHTARPVQGAREARWPAALERHGQRFEPIGRGQHVLSPPKGRHLMVLPRVLPEGIHVPSSYHGTVAVHLPTFKTHGNIGFAGAVENVWSSWMPTGGGRAAAVQHEVLVDLLTLQWNTHRSVCAVMDATIVGDGAGPRTVEPKEANALLASTDPVALDAVAASLAGFEPFAIRYLALAHALGLGCANIEEIDVIGDGFEPGELRLHARRPPAALLRTVLSELRLSRLEDWLFRRRWLVPASALYYDVLWYYTVGRQRLASFRGSAWGAVFASYAQTPG
ncbi:MAG TPA: DUF362 domain-containing protein [Chloroflexota bacterium]|nr:DUF362 domain-containing protein [Chloroflexota bacterium]